MRRTGKKPRVHVEHPSRPEPSRAYLWLILDGKREDTVEVELSEQALIELAREALNALVILRKVQS